MEEERTSLKDVVIAETTNMMNTTTTMPIRDKVVFESDAASTTSNLRHIKQVASDDEGEDYDSVAPFRGAMHKSRSFVSREDERVIFQKARKLMDVGCLFRYVTNLYAERKLVVFFLAHFAATMIIWSHFGMIKFAEQKGSVPEGAPRYWWKRLAPPLEFGSMHAILFQMSLLPLSMSRFTIANLSAHTRLDRFIPLNRSLEAHIHLGYTMVIIVFFATIFFFIFFGILCNDGNQVFCDKFTSEIMITGYCILSFLLMVAITSYFRYVIPYEIFYVLHHMVFLMYIVATAHTFDIVQRRGDRQRSQTFVWYTATLLYYICDRAAMHINNRFRTHALSSAVVSSNNGSRMILLKLRRPALWSFQPGQYAFLKVKDMDPFHWHPFSIASGPQSEYLEFYIEVYPGANSWTGKMWDALNRDGVIKGKTFWVEIIGPYGTPLARFEDYSHAIAVGSGTGVVPMLSLMKQHVRHLMRYDPKEYLQELQRFQDKIHRLDAARQPRKGSIFQKLIKCTTQRKKLQQQAATLEQEEGPHKVRRAETQRLRTSIASLHDSGGGLATESDDENDEKKVRRQQLRNKQGVRRAVRLETRSIYGVVWLTLMPVYGVSLLGLSTSWCTLPDDAKQAGMYETLANATVVFYMIYFVLAVAIWDGNSIVAYLDVGFSLVGCLSAWYWFENHLWTNMGSFDLVNYFILTGYMTVRCWAEAVRPRHKSFRREVISSGITTMEKLEFVWVTRSASLVSQVIPDITKVHNALVQAWNADYAKKVLRIRIFVTDPDEDAILALQHELAESNNELYQNNEAGGSFSFHRPDLSRIVEDHSLNMIVNSRNSYTLLAFCGSPRLSQEIHRMKINNDISTAITGNKHHQMEFVSESYGGYKSKSSANNNIKKTEGEKEEENQQAKGRNWRKDTAFNHSGISEGWIDENNDNFEYERSLVDEVTTTV